MTVQTSKTTKAFVRAGVKHRMTPHSLIDFLHDIADEFNKLGEGHLGEAYYRAMAEEVSDLLHKCESEANKRKFA